MSGGIIIFTSFNYSSIVKTILMLLLSFLFGRQLLLVRLVLALQHGTIFVKLTQFRTALREVLFQIRVVGHCDDNKQQQKVLGP